MVHAPCKHSAAVWHSLWHLLVPIRRRRSKTKNSCQAWLRHKEIKRQVLPRVNGGENKAFLPRKTAADFMMITKQMAFLPESQTSTECQHASFLLWLPKKPSTFRRILGIIRFLHGSSQQQQQPAAAAGRGRKAFFNTTTNKRKEHDQPKHHRHGADGRRCRRSRPNAGDRGATHFHGPAPA